MWVIVDVVYMILTPVTTWYTWTLQQKSIRH